MKRFAWALALLCAPAIGGGLTTYLAAPEGGTFGAGTVYAVAGGSHRAPLYDFCPLGGICLDGRSPLPEVASMPDGSLIGATQTGGLYGAGVIFRLTPGTDGWVEETLVNLCEYFRDCAHFGPVVMLHVVSADSLIVVTQTPEGRGGRWRLKLYGGPEAGLTLLQTW